jgi:hypothetical protein
MACCNVLFDIVCWGWPPEPIEKGLESAVKALVSEAVMCFAVCQGTLVDWENELVSALGLPVPELAIECKEDFDFLMTGSCVCGRVLL